MAVMVTNNIWKATWVWQLAEQVGMTSMHYRISVITGTPQGQELADQLAFLADPHCKALVANLATYKGVMVQRQSPKPVSLFEFANSGAGPGTGGPEPLPRQVSGLIATKTAFGGRRFRGRMYVPFPSETVSNSAVGSPTAGYVTALQTFANIVCNTISEAAGPNTWDAFPVIFDRTTLGFTDITGRVARPHWATQRRRGSFGSANVSPI